MKTFLSSSIVVLALVLSACGGGGGGGAVNANTPPAGGGGGGGGGTGGGEAPAAGVFIINNQSSKTVCYAQISPHSDPNWGDDQLGEDTIAAGQSHAWAAGVGVWDVRLSDCDHNVLLENTDGIDIQSNGTMLTVTD